MTLLELKEQVRDITGHPEIDPTKFLNKAQEMLDDLFELQIGRLTYDATIAVSGNTISLTGCRRIFKVREVLTSTTFRDLVKIDQSDLTRFLYTIDDNTGEEDLANPGTPYYWYPAAAVAGTVQKIVVYPATDASRTYRIFGDFYTADLVGDTDTSFWSVQFPKKLIDIAVSLVGEVYQDDRSQFWSVTAQRALREIDHVAVLMDMPEVLEING